MTDAPSPRCSSGLRELRQRAELCAKYDFDTIEMIECKWALWDEILEALHSSDGAACGDSSQASQRLSGDLQPAPSETPAPQIAGGVRERAESSIECLRAPDPALKAVPNTVRQALAEVIEQLLAALSPQAQAGGVAQEAVDCGADLCNKSLARREEAGKAGAEPVERTSSELNHSPSGNLVPSRDSERKQHEPALEPGADKSEKGASPRSADEPLTNASGLRAIHPLITNICSRHMGELMDPRACAWEIISRCERALALSSTDREGA